MKKIKSLSFFKLTVFFIIAMSLCSCREETIYYDLTEMEKSALCYYSYNNGDIFTVTDNIDTFLISIAGKELYYQFNSYLGTDRYGQVLKYDLINNASIIGGCTAQKESEDYLDYGISMFGIHGNKIALTNYSDTIGGVFYSDLYKILNIDSSNEYIITSRSQGIIYAQNDTVQYVRVY